MTTIKNMTVQDFFLNHLYRLRYWFYRVFTPWLLESYSDKDKQGRELVFYDNFLEDCFSQKGDKWVMGGGEGWGRYNPSNPLTHYGVPELLPGGLARFTAKYKPKEYDGQVYPFEVSLLSSQKSFKQRYGRFECRCSIPHDRGVWPAFWMWGSTWPPEIDVFEMYGGKKGKGAGIQKINLHYGKVKEGTKSQMGDWGIRIERKTKNPKLHEFACEWTPDKIDFFTNGVKVFQFSNKEILDKWYNVNNAQMWVVINHNLRADVIGMDEQDYYSSFLVDYVRVYK